MLSELKNYISRVSSESYWHLAIDNHKSVEVSSKSLYLRVRITGVKDKYDKDLIIFSKKGKKELMFKGKGIQIISFLAMLLIFISVISCPNDNQEGICIYKNEIILASAAIMMAIMGSRYMSRNKDKKRI